MPNTVTIPASVLYDGKWRVAHWSSAYNERNGELCLTARVEGVQQEICVYITDADLRTLRAMAGNPAEMVTNEYF